MLSKEATRDDTKRWTQKIANTDFVEGAFSSKYFLEEFDERAFLLEPRTSSLEFENQTYGVRLTELDVLIDAGQLHLPVEAIVAILAQIAESLALYHKSFGPHGRVWPRTVHLHANGAIQILLPGPSTGNVNQDFDPIYSHSVGGREQVPRHLEFLTELHATREYLAPERRLEQRATVRDDIWALGVLARHLLGRQRRKDWPDELDQILVSARHAEPEVRASDIAKIGQELRDGAYGLGLDPSISHISRVVRLFAADLSRPLAVSQWTKREEIVPNGDV